MTAGGSGRTRNCCLPLAERRPANLDSRLPTGFSGGANTVRGRDVVVVEVVVGELKWRQLGACRGLEPGIFYPDEGDEALDAKAVCADCCVRVACLEYALAVREKQGVWGGANERERRRMIRQRRRSA